MTSKNIDLSTVEYVVIRGNQYTIRKGSFRVGRPTFTMLDENGDTCAFSGAGLHPLSYFLTLRDSGKQMSGPFEHVTAYYHNTQLPEPEHKEPEHELLDVGTRVLFHDLVYDDETRKPERTNPTVGKIVGYSMNRTKYQINEERWRQPGEYYDFVTWAFADNRVQVHPDGPDDPARAQPVTQGPTGPRVYVQNLRGKQGYIVAFEPHEPLTVTVQWFSAGASPVSKLMDTLKIIHSDQVDRCPNGQTGDECGSGENQCELCLEAENEEADAIEESMGLR